MSTSTPRTAPGTGPTPLLVLDVVGLTPRPLDHMPHLKRLAQSGSRAALGTVLPAVTCAAQSTFLTGAHPSEHGIVGNGWYFRELGDVLLWALEVVVEVREVAQGQIRVPGPDDVAGRVDDPLAGDEVGAGSPEVEEGEGAELLGEFVVEGWGPGVAVGFLAAVGVVDRAGGDGEVGVFGPDDPRSLRAAADLDTALTPLLDDARAEGRTVVALSEYGITRVSRPVDINRALRRAGLLEVHTQDGMEYLDPMTSRAFAVADHQIAHVYVRRPEDLDATRAALDGLPGLGQLLDDEGKKAHHLDHPRSGELVAVAEPDAWFTYDYWLDDTRAPDFARLVEIHRKPGYDPVELFMDPLDPYVKVKTATALARKKLGMRCRMAVVPLDPSPIRGSHGRLPASDDDGPLLICSTPRAVGDRLAATDVKSLLLRLAGLT
ncbi:alkaline phosphatase family protein [Streptomyces sp. NPDC002776]